ncbi:MAG: 50S ribosomal protein L32e [Candidatus Hydrothermarchaeaceae archaeon]
MKFRRLEYFRYKKLGEKWRRPRGKHNKVRKYIGGKLPRPLIGFKKKVRGLHPSGYMDVLISNVSELENLDRDTQAVRISGKLGGRKRQIILEKTKELKLKVLNPGSSEAKQ